MEKCHISKIVSQAIEEDLWPHGDITCDPLFRLERQALFAMRMREDGIVCGLDVAREVFLQIDPDIGWSPRYRDGEFAQKGDVIARVEGCGFKIIKGERLALNFMQRLCGISTFTNEIVKRAQKSNPNIKVVDTRKTTPNLRVLEKYAVRTGGGTNHRFNLSDGVMLKNNHLAICRANGHSILDVINTLKKSTPPTMLIQAEVFEKELIPEFIEAGVNIISLQGMDVELLKECVDLIDKRTLVEASGGVTIDNVADIAATGVDFISVGALTHSAKALDIGLVYIR
jgi:nicotinate-nucleotide pyrophosphorylase (carboxylating)